MKKVLIIDDTKNIRNLLTTCLELEGYTVSLAGNGKEALELLRNEIFHLVFLDIRLPGISGTEILRQLREAGNTTPVIIMTAFGTVRNAVECTKLGAVAYLQKPFTAEKVRQVLTVFRNIDKEKEDFLVTAQKYYNQGEWEQAYRSLKQALAEEPNCGETYLLLAQVYEAQGKLAEAERFYKIAGEFQCKKC